MEKRRLISLFLVVFVIVASLSTGFVNAETLPSIELVLDSTSAEVGDMLTATIKINNVKNFGGYQVNILYDKNVFLPVDPVTGAEFKSTSMPVGGTVLQNSEYGPTSVANNNFEKAELNFGKSYVYLDDYRQAGVAEETGIIGKIGFKVIGINNAKRSEIKFFDTITMPGAITGTYLFDWNNKERISGYDVIQPGPIDLSGGSTPIAVSPTATLTPTPVTLTPSPSAAPSSQAPVTSPVVINPNPVVMPTPAKVDLVAELDAATGEAKAVIESGDLSKALEEADSTSGIKLVELKVNKVEGANTYVQQLPKESLSKTSAEYKVRVVTELGTIEVPANMLNYPDMLGVLGDKPNVALAVKEVNKEELSAELKEKIGDRPVVDISVMVDNREVKWSNTDAQVKISIPYTPNAQESLNPEHIVVLYIDDTGKAISVPSGRYDSSSGMVTFTTTHLSRYAVAYVHKTFTDIGSYAWAKKQIEVLASKGVINGTSDTTFTPKADITRADFMILLVKALGLSANVDSNFDDIDPKAYYYEYVGIAKKLGVTTGVGNNKFNPKAKITRQDMMVLTTNALKIAGKISSPGTADDVQRFTDKSQIASYAVQGVATLVKEGIVVGSGNIINPKGNASRAELAAIIYKIYNK